ncbi:MAG: TonB-dependent receptor [Candidatus Binatia bacterium]
MRMTIEKLMGLGIRLVVLWGIAVPLASWGQAAKEKTIRSKAETEIEEITVVAQKREENIQEVPISITALGSENLEQKGVRDIVDIGQAVPNLRVAAGTGSTSSTIVSLRGLGIANPNISFQSPVGLYVDGVYIAKMQGSNFDLDDLERVEVLRGPQGTLYGRNTIGGAVNFIPKKPTEERSVTLRSEVGNYDTYNGRVTLNVPLIGKNGFLNADALGTLSLRTTAGYKTHDGYFRNALRPNEPSAPAPSGGGKLNDLNRVYTITALRWQPTNALTVDYTLEYHRYRDSSTPFQLTYVYPGSPAGGRLGPAFDLRPYVQTNRVDATPANAVYGADFPRGHRLADDGNERLHILNAAWDLGQMGPLGTVTVKSISSYRGFTVNQNQDLDGSPLHMVDSSNRLDVQHWSEELQWVGTAARLRYVAGLYYYGEYGAFEAPFVVFNGGSNTTYKNIVKVQSYAPYGQLTWTPPVLNDRLSVTAGLRYSQEQFHADKFYHDIRNRKNDWQAAHGKAFGGTDALSPMGDISYQWTDDTMAYFRISRGFRGGGFNGTAGDPDSFARPFQPETLLQYEAGFKSQWFDKRLRFNASGFYSDYSDLQVATARLTADRGAVSIISNAASAEVWGMECEGTAIVFPGVEATFSYSFLAPTYKEWFDQKFDANNRPVVDQDNKPVLEDVKDKRAFAWSPKNQLTVGLTYTSPPTASGVFSAHLETYWQDKVVFIVNNQTPGAQADEGWAYALLNGRLQLSDIPLQRGSLDIAVFARNLLDRKYRSMGIDFGAALGFAGNMYGDPRTFGLQLTYNFTAS